MKAEAATYAGMAFALTVLVACSGVPNAAPSSGADPVMGVVKDPAAAGGEQLGYLSAANTPDAAQVIPPAPKEGEARNDVDWSIFRATRVLEGSERWKLAINDDSYKPEDLLKDFSCSVDAQLTVAKAPTLAKILARVGTDASNAAAGAKNLYKRTRPFLHNPGNICIERSEGLVKSFDYPSGHASASWVEGLVIAELAPDRATQVLQRARAYGESRIVCGLHNWSAVESGRTNGASVFAALHSSSEFRTDMAKAREELDIARKSGAKPDAAACAKEADLTKPLAVK
jgi:acid phosphatase (class A)